MRLCSKCDIMVDNPVERCPLCYSMLTSVDNEPEVPSYPDLSGRAEKYNIIFRILLFLSLTVGSVCLTINILTFNRYWWSLIVIANIAFMWISIGLSVRKQTKLGFNIMVQAISLAALMLIIGQFVEHIDLVFNYVLPFVFISATLSITIIVIVKRVDIQRFVLYFILIALLGFIPVLGVAFHFVTVLWPSVVSALYSALSLVSIFIFADYATKIELKKRFHI